MEIKDLSREIILAEALSERGKMVMELNTMVGNLQKENEAKEQEVQRLQEKVKELEKLKATPPNPLFNKEGEPTGGGVKEE